MKTGFRSSFDKDLHAIRNQAVRERVARFIESVEKAKDLNTIPGLKKLHGDSRVFRARVGEYRIGLKVEGETVEFVRCLDRKEIYRFFP